MYVEYGSMAFANQTLAIASAHDDDNPAVMDLVRDGVALARCAVHCG
jgi:hypothetical protein